jgi:hypothetical protein
MSLYRSLSLLHITKNCSTLLVLEHKSCGAAISMSSSASLNYVYTRSMPPSDRELKHDQGSAMFSVIQSKCSSIANTFNLPCTCALKSFSSIAKGCSLVPCRCEKCTLFSKYVLTPGCEKREPCVRDVTTSCIIELEPLWRDSHAQCAVWAANNMAFNVQKSVFIRGALPRNIIV